MLPGSRFAKTAATHGLALAGGWLLLSRLHPQTNITPPAAPTKVAPRATPPERSVDEIFAELTAEKPKPPPKPRQNPYLDAALAAESAIRGMTLPAGFDFATAVDEEMKALPSSDSESPSRSPKLVGLMYHWLVADPTALFKWAGTDPARLRVLETHAHLAVQHVIEDRGPTSLLDALGSAGKLDNTITNTSARMIAKNGDATALAKLKDHLAPERWKLVIAVEIREWPVENKEDLLQLALQENAPDILATIASKSMESSAWVARVADDNSLPEEFRKQLLEDRELQQLLSKNPLTPLEDRLRYLNSPYRDHSVSNLVHDDVSRLMSSSQDWGASLRRGDATAEEIYQAIAAGTPDIAASEPGQLRSVVFGNLAEHDPAKALSLIKDLPPSEQQQKMIEVARTAFNDVDPDLFLEALQLVPSDSPGLWEQRLDAWNLNSIRNFNRLDEGFINWVRQLPPGLDRQMGLYSLARALEPVNRDLAAELRSKVTDPELQKRIPKANP